MGQQRIMRHLTRWHIWLGWLIGVPVIVWTVTGLVMVARPIEEVRGDHLRKDTPIATLPAGNPRPIAFPAQNPARYSEMRVVMQGQRPVWLLTTSDGAIERYPADGDDTPLPTIDETYVRALVAERIVGGDQVTSVTRFAADEAPFDLRRPIPGWQVMLADRTNIYIHAQTGELVAIRTRWWRLFDFMWGLHIMDLQTRENTSHPILILFAAISAIGTLIGFMLLFRRRRAHSV